jgi:ferredoxin
MSVVFILDGKRFDPGTCDRNLNLLAHAQLIELPVGSQCGGHGKCGRDRVRIAEEGRVFLSRPTAIERMHLTDEEIGSGIRLACQCFPERDGVLIEVFPVNP